MTDTTVVIDTDVPPAVEIVQVRDRAPRALPATIDKKTAKLREARKSAVLLPDESEPKVEAPTPAVKPKRPVSTANRMFIVRVVAPGSKLDANAVVVWNNPKAGEKFNGDKNKSRFRMGVESGKTTVGELLKLEGGPTSGDLRHWVEHNYSADGPAWIEISGMKYREPKK